MLTLIACCSSPPGVTAAIIDSDIAVANRFMAVLLDPSACTVARVRAGTTQATAHAPRNTAHQCGSDTSDLKPSRSIAHDAAA
ncbi:hypothetical protein ACULL5_01865 [Xanthomonas arboricola pv. corylina]